jgi:hypothetical protein
MPACQLGGENYHILTGSQVLSLLALLVQSTNTGFAGTKVQILTQRAAATKQ